MGVAWMNFKINKIITSYMVYNMASEEVDLVKHSWWSLLMI